jgi:DNA mismatch repair protein MutL
VSDIIKLLPDSVANQIAAGEVIQRPASVVKELMENAIDAGASDVKVVIKDAGSTLIQIIDNGCGLSEMDARMAFERHATSKIADSQDLFKLRTNGFRGEALASIAAIAQVELKSKRAEDELGTQILISGSELEKQESTVCSNGSNMMVKNLFYNVPARRRFLKKNEFSYIDSDFKRIALTYPEISMSLTHNDNTVHSLPASRLRQRIVHVFGKAINGKLVSINSDTSLAHISGFVSTPETAKKTRGEQYFFVNGRYMKHPYFNHKK